MQSQKVYILTSGLDYKRRFLDSLATWGPNNYHTALALNDWARADSRETKTDHLYWTVQRQ